MIEENKKSVLKQFQVIPCVGVSIAEDLWNLGFRSLDQLKEQEPEDLYEKTCAYQGIKIDRCLLYVFRCMVYFLSNENHDPELLKWWNWKDVKKSLKL